MTKDERTEWLDRALGPGDVPRDHRTVDEYADSLNSIHRGEWTDEEIELARQAMHEALDRGERQRPQ
jgi:hypothetical protein